ncbi:hypothetical protein ACFL1B_05980 [Nanoarchaeota archaeon]
MERKYIDGFFVVLAIALVWTAWNYNAPAQGQAFETPETVIPHIDMISPAKRATFFQPVQNFAFEVKAVDYNSVCWMVVDDEQQGEVLTAVPGGLNEFKLNLEEGYYTYRVECKLLNGRTISSAQRSVRVESYHELADAVNIPRPTGRVIVVSDFSPSAKGLVIVLALVGGFVWIVNFRRKK